VVLKFLLVTGQLAKNLVEKYAEESHVEYEIFDLPTPVAALLTARTVAEALTKVAPKGFDAILTPGFIFGDVSIIEQATGIPTFKGPRYAADLPTVLEMYDRVKLSKVVPACELLRDELRKKALDELSAVEKKRDELLQNRRNFLIGALPIGKDFPMRILAEIVDAPLLSNEQIAERAKYYIRSGADMIDVGMIVGAGREEDAKRAVKAVKTAVSVPVSIDTIDPVEAKAGVEAGADLVLSVDGGNVEEMAPFARRVAAVVIPTNHRKGEFPKRSDERVEKMRGNIEAARELGMKRVLADLILDPIGSPGFVESIVSYYKFGMNEREVPLFAGVGNVVELLDADTIGVNALAAGVASELGIDVLLTTEVSNICKGCVKELSTASKMMFLAKRRGSIPKGLGIDLLFLKEKRFLEEPYDHKYVEGATEIQGISGEESRMDRKGCFKIMINRDEEMIVAIHYPIERRDRSDFVVRGRTAKEIYSAVLKSNLISEMTHSAYLGYELGKAETALKTGRNYLQDSMLFT
jgi:dihydropteroate synthase-like protein